MVLKRIWSVEHQGRDYIRLSPFKEYNFKLNIKEPGHYHFVCGLPHSLNVNKAFQVEKEKLKMRHKINKATAEKSKYSVKVNMKVFNSYVTLLKDKKVISLKGEKVLGEVHMDFNLKPKYVTDKQPMTICLKLVSHSIIKRLKVSASLYKTNDDTENEKDIMRTFLKQVFERKDFNEKEFFEQGKEKLAIENQASQDTYEIENQDTWHSKYNELSLNKAEVGQILLSELFSHQKPSNINNNYQQNVINIGESDSFKDHVRQRSESDLRQTILDNLKVRYPKVKYTLAANPFQKDSFHEMEKESTFLTDFQIQILNYECLPKTLQYSSWKQRYNSNIFGFNLTEIIRLCSSSIEPQLIVIKDEKDYIFGGFLRNGLYMKNTYNQDAVLNFPSAYHSNFSLTNYDIKPGYSDVGEESGSFVFTFLGSGEDLSKYEWTEKNRMFRMVNQKGIGMGGGSDGFAFMIDHTVQFGSSAKSETFGNEILASQSRFSIKSVEIWGIHSSFEPIREAR